MNKLTTATLAVAALLAVTPAIAGETTLHADGKTVSQAAAPAVPAAPAVTAPVAASAELVATPTVTTPAAPAVETPVEPAVAAAPLDPLAPAATATVAPETALPAGSAKVESYVMKDGTNVVVMEKQAFVVGADGSKKAAPDGEIVTKDGVTLKVQGGMIVSDTAAAPAATPAPEAHPATTEPAAK